MEIYVLVAVWCICITIFLMNLFVVYHMGKDVLRFFRKDVDKLSVLDVFTKIRHVYQTESNIVYLFHLTSPLCIYELIKFYRLCVILESKEASDVLAGMEKRVENIVDKTRTLIDSIQQAIRDKYKARYLVDDIIIATFINPECLDKIKSIKPIDSELQKEIVGFFNQNLDKVFDDKAFTDLTELYKDGTCSILRFIISELANKNSYQDIFELSTDRNFQIFINPRTIGLDSKIEVKIND